MAVLSKPNPDFIPHSRPTLGPREAEAVAKVIASGHIAEGEVLKRFERAFAGRLQAGHAVGTSSGTAALHLALLALGVQAGDEVILPSFVCTALLNAVNYVGAVPVLADIDPDSGNIDPADVQKRITHRTRAVIAAHMFGLAADLAPLLALNVPIIEDCAQAVGAAYHDRPVGTFGSAAVFSFYATKVMATAEGGMVVCGFPEFARRVRDLKTYDERQDYKIRFNYKLSDIQAAIGLVQLERLEDFLRLRRAIACRYREALAPFGLKLPPDDPGHIYFRFVVGLDTDARPWIEILQQKGIGCARPVYLPLHRYLKRSGFPNTEKMWRQSLSIPIYPSLTTRKIDRIIDIITDTYTDCH